MPSEDIQSWSITASANGTADSAIDWQEHQQRKSVNNSARSMMAAHAKHRNLLNGSIITTGTANAQQFLSGHSYTTIPTGLRVRLKIGPGLTNNSVTTLNMDGTGAVAVKTSDGNNMLGGELVAGDYADLLYDGSSWIFLYAREFFQELITGGGGIIVGKQIFTASGTYTPTTGMECCIIECVGGGGPGGVAAATVGYISGGGGGGGGGYSRTWSTATAIGASQVVTIGAAGGTTSVGAICTATGGAPGSGGDNSNIGQGGAGGFGTGDFVVAGGNGGNAVYGSNLGLINVQPAGGDGGGSHFGEGGAGAIGSGGSATPGGAGSNYGGGGGGASAIQTATGTPAAGGSGAPGVVVITEFGGRGAPGRDGATGPAGPPGPAGPGTGNVLVSGTPTAGQYARWVSSSAIEGYTPAEFSTGDAKLTLKTVADSGWVMMNDGTIGSATSGASFAHITAQALFTLLFDNITDAWAPIQTSAGAATTRAAQTNAVTAWAANCRMSLTRQLGRTLAIAGAGSGLTSRTLGSFVGEELHTPTLAEMAGHSHSFLASVPVYGAVEQHTPGTGSYAYIWVGGTASFSATQNEGSGSPFNVMQPTAFWNIMIKL